jgi:hypothetical protein
VILYRHAPPGFPFLWETPDQPAGRWHATGRGPVQYLADTPDGAWAEFLRHEEINLPEELEGIARSIWAVEVPDGVLHATVIPQVAPDDLVGGLGSYAVCQAEAARIRAEDAPGLRAPSAALVPGGAQPWQVHGGLQPAPARDGEVIVLFGPRPDLIGWRVADAGRPAPDLLPRVRPLEP